MSDNGTEDTNPTDPAAIEAQHGLARDLGAEIPGARPAVPTVADDDSEPIIERRSIKRNLADMVSSQLVTWALATVLAVVVPRYLPPETAGELRLATSLWLMAAIFVDFGSSMYLQLEIARRPRNGISLLGPALVVRSLVWTVAIVVITTYAVVVEGSGRFISLVLLIGAAALISSWAGLLGTAFVGMERMSTSALVAVTTRALNVASIVVYLVLGGGIVGVVLLGVVSALFGLAQIMWHFRRVASLQFDDWRARLRPIIRAGRPFMLLGVGLVVYQQIDVIVISWVADREDLGWYSTADQMVGSLLFPATAITAVVFPTFGRLHASDPAELRRLVERVFSLLVLAGVPIGLGTMVVAQSFAPVLFGEDYREVGDVLVALGPVIAATFGTVLFGTVALTTERGRIWVIVLFASAALTVPLDLVLVPWADDRYGNGAIGGAMAFIVTETFQFVVGIVVVVPFLARWSTLWRMTRILIAGGIMVAATWPFREVFVVVPALIGAAVYGVAVLALRVLTVDERDLLRQALGRGG